MFNVLNFLIALEMKDTVGNCLKSLSFLNKNKKIEL